MSTTAGEAMSASARVIASDVAGAPWATLLARTFDVDVKCCTRCGGRLEVRAVVTDHEVARRILEAIPLTARAPPIIDTAFVSEAALA
jgi:hypothetical protein